MAGRLLGKMLTTDFVIVEFGNFFSNSNDRQSFLNLLDDLAVDSWTTVLPPSWELVQQGIELFSHRPDKDWSLTDCISFVVTQDHGITEALTADRHFEQVGFVPLLA